MKDRLEMTFFEHISELRNRILRVFASLILFSVIGFYFHKPILDIIIKPISPVVISDNLAESEYDIDGSLGNIKNELIESRFQQTKLAEFFILCLSMSIFFGFIFCVVNISQCLARK